MAPETADHRAPPLRFLLREGVAVAARVYGSFGSLGPRGAPDAPPLMVIPGFFASDRSTLGLQRALARDGYRVTGWGLGRNLGARADTIDRIVERLEAFSEGSPAILVGWSLGGIYARETAKQRPDLVTKVVTMGSPFSGNPRANNAWRLYELVSRHPVDRPPIAIEPAAKPPVPTLALWSRRDGMVAPASARGEGHESDRQLELDCSHMGFATSPRAFRAIARAIKQF